MKDEIKKFLAINGKISCVCANTTSLVEEAVKIHDLSPVVSAAFGRLLTISAIMASEMKSKKNKLTIQINSSGPIGGMLVTAENTPKLKGYVKNPYVDIPLNDMGKLDVSGALGNEEYINVIKDLGLKEPYIGISPLVSGEIAEDFTEYFAKSEQRNTAIALGVLVNKDGIKASGGYLITAMPDATDEDITKVEQAIFKAGAISRLLEQNLSLEEIAMKVTGDNNIKLIEENIFPKYECDCSKEHMKEALKALGKEELTKILKEDKKIELTCHFCNQKYSFDENELLSMLVNED